jgi:hypothetical protein
MREKGQHRRSTGQSLPASLTHGSHRQTRNWGIFDRHNWGVFNRHSQQRRDALGWPLAADVDASPPFRSVLSMAMTRCLMILQSVATSSAPCLA